MKIYLVGGAVRDKLLNLSIKDRDWVIVGGDARTLIDQGYKQVGKDFPVFIHPITHEEYALARIERKFGVGYSGFKTNFSKKITLEEDLMRRDLTINAIAQDNLGKYIDPFNGKKDLQLRLLKHISNKFKEDPLRVLRVARFAASLSYLGFRIAKQTMILMSDISRSKELLYLTSDRIWKETEKALLTSHPHVYFKVLYDCQALPFVFPELHKLFFMFFPFNINNKFINMSKFVLMGLSKISLLSKDIDVRFASLCQLFSNIFIVYKDKIQKYVYYNKSAAFLTKTLCQRLHVPSYIKDLSIIISGFNDFLNSIYYQSSKDIIKLFDQIDAWRKPDRIKKLSLLSNIYVTNFIFSKFVNYDPGEYLKYMFNVANTVSVKSVIQLGFIGLKIRMELTRLRILSVEKARIDFLRNQLDNKCKYII